MCVPMAKRCVIPPPLASLHQASAQPEFTGFEAVAVIYGGIRASPQVAHTHSPVSRDAEIRVRASERHRVVVITLAIKDITPHIYNSSLKSFIWPAPCSSFSPAFILKWLSIIWKSSGGCGIRPDSILDQTGKLSREISNAPVEMRFVSMALPVKKGFRCNFDTWEAKERGLSRLILMCYACVCINRVLTSLQVALHEKPMRKLHRKRDLFAD